MASEAELVERLRAFLSTSDLDLTTTAIVRRKLEEEFGIDLSDKKAFIRDQVDRYLQEIRGNEEDNEGEQEEQEETSVAEAEEERESEEDEDESEEATDEKKPAKRRSKKKNEEVKKRGGGFTKLCSLSPQLQKFTGVPELAKTEVVKQIWSYIREKNLQDPTDRRNIVCDDALRELFNVDAINMFQMNKALAQHIWPLGSTEAPAASAPKEKPQKQDRKKDREEEPDDPKRKGKRQKGGNSAFLASLPLSDALIKFLNTGENALPRSDVIKRIWDYVKLNNLQDPSDRRMILCDEKLKELFDVDTFQGFTVSKLLKDHFIKPDQ